MNADATLKIIRSHAADRLEIEHNTDAEGQDPEMVEFCAAVQALDAWLSSGGGLPTDWASEHEARHVGITP